MLQLQMFFGVYPQTDLTEIVFHPSFDTTLLCPNCTLNFSPNGYRPIYFITSFEKRPVRK